MSTRRESVCVPSARFELFRTVSSLIHLSSWNTVYPLYFDAKVSINDGRRVPRQSSIWWPQATHISQACRSLGLLNVLEVSDEALFPASYGISSSLTCVTPSARQDSSSGLGEPWSGESSICQRRSIFQPNHQESYVSVSFLAALLIPRQVHNCTNSSQMRFTSKTHLSPIPLQKLA